MSKNYQAIEGGYGSVPVTPGMVGAADRIRTGDGQLGKPPKGHTRISRALLLHSLTSTKPTVTSRGLPTFRQNSRQKNGRISSRNRGRRNDPSSAPGPLD